MNRQNTPQKKQRATAWTDLCRLILCGGGCFLIGAAVKGYFDEEPSWPLTAMIICAAIGLGFVGVGVFAKPKAAESIVESVSP